MVVAPNSSGNYRSPALTLVASGHPHLPDTPAGGTAHDPPPPQRSLATVLAAVCIAATGLIASASPVAAAEPLAGEIETRDQLIAAQENLLNSYRCLYDTDTGLVPGGCGDPDQIEPGPAPATPTQNDKDARDNLIAAQENLLNIYRCQFDVDTQLVPGGCQNETPETGTPETGTQIAISAGYFHSCGIRADGSVACWGNNEEGQSDAPEGVFTAIEAGYFHSCGIKADGSAVCWGNNFGGKADAPEGVFTAISAAWGHTCGIKADGSVVCWGDNDYGELDAPEGVFTAISANGDYSCGIKADGTVACWGRFSQYQNEDRILMDWTAYAPEGVFTAISAGDSHSCGIKADGSAVCWGDLPYGLNAPEGQFAAISAGYFHSCGIRADGSVVCWGVDFIEETLDAPEGVFAAISAGYFYSCGTRADGSAACWGGATTGDDYGQFNAPEGVFGPAR